MKKRIMILIAVLLTLGITACESREVAVVSPTVMPEGIEQSITESEETAPEPIDTGNSLEPAEEADQEDSSDMIMKIGETQVQVVWEGNEAVEFLRQAVMEAPLLIEMSMYGGFEQVGPIGQTIPNDDEQITTKAGDIVLYSGNQMVVFYGSNSWAYTRLGHISDKSEKELTELLGNGNVTITLESGEN